MQKPDIAGLTRMFWMLSQASRATPKYNPTKARIILAAILKHGSPLLQQRARNLIGDQHEPSRNPAE